MPSAQTIIYRLSNLSPPGLFPVRYLVREDAWLTIRAAAESEGVLSGDLIFTGEVEVVPEQIVEVLVHSVPNPFVPEEGVLRTEGYVLYDGMDEDDDVVEPRRMSRDELNHKIAETAYRVARYGEGRSHDQAIGDVARVMSLLEKARSGS